MRVPYFRAKDKDSETWVEGFYVEFPEHPNINTECKLIHAIMVIVPEAIGDTFRNTLSFCTIDVNTLVQIGEIEIGGQYFNPSSYIQNPHSQIILG